MNPPSIPPAVLGEIKTHVKSITDREVGGVLIGTLGGDDHEETRIVGAIPALKALGASANVTFTHEVWDDALATVERHYPDQRIVGWYHSHPDFGVFLSEYDLFIQQNFFPTPGMMALVIDPLRGDAGWFTTIDGEVSQIGSFAVTPVARGATQQVELATTRTRSRSVILYGVAAAIAAFAVGWMMSPGDETTDTAALQEAEQSAEATEARAAEAERRSAEAEARLQDLEVVYVVTIGDSLWEIAERFYGDGTRWLEISAANDIGDGGIEPGHRLVIPGAVHESDGAFILGEE